MVSGVLMGSGALILAILIALTEMQKWPRKTHYYWAVIAAIWGIISFF